MVEDSYSRRQTRTDPPPYTDKEIEEPLVEHAFYQPPRTPDRVESRRPSASRPRRPMIRAASKPPQGMDA